MPTYNNTIQPARYTSQFDPAKEQLTQNILQQRSQRFEQSFTNMSQEEAKVGETFFLDQQAKDDTLGNLNNEKEEILKKYENNYEAAAPELARLVVQERANPIYDANKYQQQKMQERNALLTKLGPDAIVSKDVSQSLRDETGRVRSISDFDYDIKQRSDYDEKIANGMKGIAGTIQQSDLIDSDRKGYLSQLTEKGLENLSDEEKDDLALEYSKIFEAETTFNIDPVHEGITSAQYVRDAMDRLIASGKTKAYKFDQNAALDRRLNADKTKPVSNPLITTMERGVEAKKDTSVIDSYQKNNDLVSRVEQHGGKLDVLTKVAAISKAFGHSSPLSPGGLGSAMMELDKTDNTTQLNAWIEALQIDNAETVDQFMIQDQNGNYKFGANKAAGANKLGKVLSDMVGNDENYIDKVTAKQAETNAAFQEKYGVLYESMKQAGVAEDDIIPIIQQAQDVSQFNNIYNLNSKEATEKIHSTVLSRLGEGFKLFEVNEDGIISDKAVKGGRDTISKKNAGTIKSADIDPQTGSILMTYENTNGTIKTYAIKAGTGTLDKVGDQALTRISDFTRELNDITKLRTIIPAGDDHGYLINRDPKTLEPTVIRVELDENGVKSLGSPINTSVVYDDLLSQLLKSQGIVNKPTPIKF